MAYAPWNPDWLFITELDEDNEPRPLATMPDLFRMSADWVATVAEAQAEKAKREIASMARSAGYRTALTARHQGMLTALGAAIAEMPAPDTWPDSWVPNRVAAVRTQKRTFRDWWRWTALYNVGRARRYVLGTSAMILRKGAEWLESKYGW